MATPVKIGTEFLVSAITANNQYAPSITELTNGQFLDGWEDILPPPGGAGGYSVYGIQGQIFNANGAPSGNPFDIWNLSALSL
jgi:large repetitive protein